MNYRKNEDEQELSAKEWEQIKKKEREKAFYLRLLYITRAGTVAALYAAITFLTSSMSFTQGQLRIADALCVLPFFMPEAVPGLFIGCLAANFMSPYGAIDIIFGSLATLLAAFLASKIKRKWIVPAPTVFINAVVIGTIITAGGEAFTFEAFRYNFLSMIVSGIISCYMIGMPLMFIYSRWNKHNTKVNL